MNTFGIWIKKNVYYKLIKLPIIYQWKNLKKKKKGIYYLMLCKSKLIVNI